MTAHVLLIGASGWLGRRILKAIPEARTLPAMTVIADAAAVRGALMEGTTVVVNAAGARRGDPAELERWNVMLPTMLAHACSELGGHLVHLGSAAEYGMQQPDGWCTESAVAAPESDYGRTKLAGSLAALTAPSATVLRVFNLAGEPPQAGTPFADVIDRTREALLRGERARLVAPGTVRDWVAPDFVVGSVVAAAAQRPVGLFNLCSGVGVEFGAAVTEALRLLGSDAGVEAGGASSGPIVGDPSRWAAASGIAEQLTTAKLASVIARNVDSLLPERRLDPR